MSSIDDRCVYCLCPAPSTQNVIRLNRSVIHTECAARAGIVPTATQTQLEPIVPLDLLRRYVRHVLNHESVTFLESYNRDEDLFPDDDQWALLRRISDEL